jgi:hypothetical protein
VSRFRPGNATQFYLWQAELSHRQETGGTVFAVGRIWPWHLPGVTLLDGFQIGRRSQAGTAEGGGYAGFLPTPLSITPSADTWGAGLYGTLTQVGSARGLFRLARQVARVGVWRGDGGPAARWVTEAEANTQVWLGPTSLAGGGRVRSGGSTGTGPVLERVFFDFQVRPTAPLGGGVHLRYFGVSPGVAALVGQVPAVRGSIHVAADVHATPWPWLGVAGFAGVNGDRETGRQQRHGAAEVRLPRVAGPYAGLAVGAEGQEGWLRARALYADVVGRPGAGLIAWARLSAMATQFPAQAAAAPATPELHEVGWQLRVDGAIASWMRVQAWCAMRVPWLIRGEPPPVPSTGLTAGVGLRGVL